MAKYSGVFNLNSAYTLYLEVTETDVTTSTNKSKVKWTLTIESTKSLEYGSYDYDGTPFSVTINGMVVSSGEKKYDFTEYKTLIVASGTTDPIQHNTDGSKTVACSATFGANDTPIGKATAQGNFTLTKISRASTFSVSTQNTKVEDVITLTINSASASYTHKIGWYYNDKLVGTVSSIKNLKSDITVPTALYTTFLEKNKNSLKFVLKCGTYSGNKYIGVTTKNITIGLSNNRCKPIIRSMEILNIAESKLGMTPDNKIVLDKNVSLNVKATYEYNSTAYMTAVKIKKGIQGNEPLVQVINNISLNDSIKITEGILVSDGKTLVSENKYLYYTAPTINIKTPSVNFESYYETNAENNTSELKYKITSFVSEIDYNFLSYFPNGKTDLNVFSYRYYIGIQKEDVNYTESILPGEENKNKFVISYPSKELPEKDVAITLDNLLTPLYLIIEYKDETSSAATQIKEIRISPLFDWSEEDFKFSVPVEINAPQANNKGWYNPSTTLGGALNLNNGDIIKANQIFFADKSDAAGEGLCFPNGKVTTNTNGPDRLHYDCLKAHDGKIYFIPNHPTNIDEYEVPLCYKKGETLKFNDQSEFWTGVVTSGQKQLVFTIPLDRPLASNVTGVSITANGTFLCRVAQGGYLIFNGATDTDISYTSSKISSKNITIPNRKSLKVSITATNVFECCKATKDNVVTTRETLVNNQVVAVSSKVPNLTFTFT